MRRREVGQREPCGSIWDGIGGVWDGGDLRCDGLSSPVVEWSGSTSP